MKFSLNLDNQNASISEILRAIGFSVDSTTDLTTANTLFLSIITAIEDIRLEMLKEIMLCLIAQDYEDFEWILVVNNSNNDIENINQLLNSSSIDFREKINLITVMECNKARLLNIGINKARGKYVAILNDNDLVLGHWIRAFFELSLTSPGRILRAAPLQQNASIVHTEYSQDTIRAESKMTCDLGSEYNFFAQLHQNSMPESSIACPTFAIHEFGMCFDDTLTTAIFWDFIGRAIAVCGVVNETSPTNINRFFSSVHNENQIKERFINDINVKKKMNNIYTIAPPGMISELIKYYEYEKSLKSFEYFNENYNAEWDQIYLDFASNHKIDYNYIYLWQQMCEYAWWEIRELDVLKNSIDSIFRSTSWRITIPIRVMQKIMRQEDFTMPDLFFITKDDANYLLDHLYHTISWKATGWLRRVKLIIKSVFLK